MPSLGGEDLVEILVLCLDQPINPTMKAMSAAFIATEQHMVTPACL